MPLVVPGITSNSGDKTQEWTNKLVGKKITDEPSSEVVCDPLRLLQVSNSCDDQKANSATGFQNFCKRDLPDEHRVIEPGMMVTKDYKPERLNVHLKEDGTVSHVVHG